MQLTISGISLDTSTHVLIRIDGDRAEMRLDQQPDAEPVWVGTVGELGHAMKRMLSAYPTDFR